VLPRQALITGGAGFLGAHLVDCFRQAEIPVRLLDQTERPNWTREPGIEYVRGDVRDPATLAAALAGVDTVVHAAFASPWQSREVITQVNIEGTRRLCTEALARGVRRLLLLSSTIVLKPRRVHPFFPNAPLSRLDCYRASRVAAEAIVTEYGNKGLSVAIVRPKTFLGPGRVSAFALLFERIRRGQPVPVLGPGRNHYQLLDVRDMAEGVQLLAASEAEGTFGLGTREFGTVREDLQALLDYAQTGAQLWVVPGWLARVVLYSIELAGLVPLSEWHHLSACDKDSVVDISRAERELGWRPKRSNGQTLRDAYAWYAASIAQTGTAQTLHPVPLSHRALKGIAGIFSR
jgi:nucleoside-diphosphate-sugar epimerase